MSLLDMPQVRDWMGSRLLMRVDTEEPRVALTFDDGPSPRNTAPLLDLLGARGVPATFFVLGRYVRRHPELVARMAREGHEVANHGNWHLPLPFLPTPWVRREIRGTGEEVEAITGRRPVYYRPANGWFNRRILEVIREEGYRPVIGDVYPVDSRKPGVGVLVERILSRVGPGSIIILHDGGWQSRTDRGQTIEAVGEVILRLRDRGMRFETLASLEGPGGSATPGTGSPGGGARAASGR